MQYLEFFMNVLLAPISFLVIFLVQLKIISMLRSSLNLSMHYGKQIEDIRKIVSHQPKRMEISSEDTGLYEVLSD